MIILEGPDGAGKTMLAARLADNFGVEIAPKVVQSDMTSEIPLFEWTLQQIEGWPRKIIYDRFPLISEFIYGPIYKHNVRTGFNHLQKVTEAYDRFYEKKPLIVYCLPPFAAVWNNVQDEDTDNAAVKDDGRLRGVYYRYVQEAARTHALVWDYTAGGYDALEYWIKNETMRRNRLGY